MLTLLSLGFSVPVAVVGGGAVGFLLDRALGTLPWLSVLFLGFGVAAGIRNVIRAASAAAPATGSDGRPPPEAPDPDGAPTSRRP